MTTNTLQGRPTGDGFQIARYRRLTSIKFKRLCVKSREWQNRIDAKRHEAKLQAATK